VWQQRGAVGWLTGVLATARIARQAVDMAKLPSHEAIQTLCDAGNREATTMTGEGRVRRNLKRLCQDPPPKPTRLPNKPSTSSDFIRPSPLARLSWADITTSSMHASLHVLKLLTLHNT